jgi:hypothetical protein
MAKATTRERQALSKRALRIYTIVKQYGPPVGLHMSVVDIQKYIPEITVDCISPRMPELRQKRWLLRIGKAPRPNRTGRTQSQWVYRVIDEDELR